MSSNPWIARRAPAGEVHTRVFALPHAGAGASVYFGWPAALLSEGIDFVPLQPPGRENRFADPPRTSLTMLVDEAADAIAPLLDRPFALFGHSMGALVGFELARLLTHRGYAPRRLFASGARAPQLTRTEAPLHVLDDDRFLQAVADRYGGMPPQLVASADLRAIVLPALRADLTIVETYEYDSATNLSCPLDVLRGRDDVVVRPTAIAGWRDVTSGPVRIIDVDGDHFFVRTAARVVQRHVASALGCH